MVHDKIVVAREVLGGHDTYAWVRSVEQLLKARELAISQNAAQVPLHADDPFDLANSFVFAECLLSTVLILFLLLSAVS